MKETKENRKVADVDVDKNDVAEKRRVAQKTGKIKCPRTTLGARSPNEQAKKP